MRTRDLFIVEIILGQILQINYAQTNYYTLIKFTKNELSLCLLKKEIGFSSGVDLFEHRWVL
jgi:hypothetical protein